MADELLCSLILASEKASRIARLCRENKSLFSLLIQEKGEKNNEIDFKTLADVFIQQLVTKEMKSKFGSLADHVQGEENTLFTNTMGETVAVELGSCAKETAEMLSKVLNGNGDAARILSEAAHEDISMDYRTFISSETLQEIQASKLDLTKIGIWIDPIDCTSQYVEGIEDSTPVKEGIYESGLQCVMVLIGVYCLESGKPIMGIINQPFCHSTMKSGQRSWKERCVWGYSYNKVKKNNLPLSNNKNLEKHLIVLSLHDPEAKSVLNGLSTAMDTCLCRGAGYKCATVFDQLADAFVYTFNGSYKWDTCAPHAILLSCGGGIAVLDSTIKALDTLNPDEDLSKVLESCQVKYKAPVDSTTNWKANAGGLMVYNGTEHSWKATKKILNAFVRLHS